MSLVDSVLSARRRALPVYLSPDTNAIRVSVLEQRAVTMTLSAFFDAGARVQQTTPGAAVAKRYFCCVSLNENATISSVDGQYQEAIAISPVTHPSLNAALMNTLCPSRKLLTKVLLSIVESVLRNIQHVCCSSLLL